MPCCAVFVQSSKQRKQRQYQYLTLDLVDGLGQAADVLAGDAGHGDATVLGSVDGVLLID
jgi:hypothetical protein